MGSLDAEGAGVAGPEPSLEAEGLSDGLSFVGVGDASAVAVLGAGAGSLLGVSDGFASGVAEGASVDVAPASSAGRTTAAAIGTPVTAGALTRARLIRASSSDTRRLRRATRHSLSPMVPPKT